MPQERSASYNAPSVSSPIFGQLTRVRRVNGPEADSTASTDASVTRTLWLNSSSVTWIFLATSASPVSVTSGQHTKARVRTLWHLRPSVRTAWSVTFASSNRKCLNVLANFKASWSTKWSSAQPVRLNATLSNMSVRSRSLRTWPVHVTCGDSVNVNSTSLGPTWVSSHPSSSGRNVVMRSRCRLTSLYRAALVRMNSSSTTSTHVPSVNSSTWVAATPAVVSMANDGPVTDSRYRQQSLASACLRIRVHTSVIVVVVRLRGFLSSLDAVLAE